MESVILDGLFGQLGVSLSQKLIIDSNTVVGKGLSMAIVDTFAHLQELEVVINGLPVLFDVVVKDTN